VGRPSRRATDFSKPEVGDLSGSITVTGSTTYTGYENAPPNTSTSDTTTLALADITNGMGGDAQPARSSESILEEYRDRSEQVARLQDALASETNPDVRDYYQLQIDTHNNILTTLTTEALAAGITQAELNQTTTQAQTTAANDPISQQTLNTPFFDGTWFDGGTFGSTLAGEVGSIGVGFAAMFNDLIGNNALAAQQYQWAYENGPLGLTADSDGFYYYVTRGMLGIASGATAAAGSIIAWQAANGLAMYAFGVQGYGVTGHAALQAMNRGITYRMVHQAIGRAAMAQTGIYRGGALQTVFNGVNGVTVPVTISGRFAGLIRTVFHSANRTVPFWPSL
jgi:hypothetical protein